MVPHTHNEIDSRLLRLHQAVADRLRSEPSLIDEARTTLRRWRARGIASEALRSWEDLIEGPREKLLTDLVADTPAMRELRQSSPFAGTVFVDANLRRKILDEPCCV